MAQELDLGPGVVVYDYTPAQWASYLDHKYECSAGGVLLNLTLFFTPFMASFAPWGASFGDQVNQLYAVEAAVNPQKAFDTIGADAEVICGNLDLATAAGEGFTSPVYAYVNVYEPSAPVEAGVNTYNPRYRYQ